MHAHYGEVCDMCACCTCTFCLGILLHIEMCMEKTEVNVLFQKLCNLPSNYVGKWGRIEIFILRCTVMILSAGVDICLSSEYVLWWEQFNISFFLTSELSGLSNPDDKRQDKKPCPPNKTKEAQKHTNQTQTKRNQWQTLNLASNESCGACKQK